METLTAALKNLGKQAVHYGNRRYTYADLLRASGYYASILSSSGPADAAQGEFTGRPGKTTHAQRPCDKPGQSAVNLNRQKLLQDSWLTTLVANLTLNLQEHRKPQANTSRDLLALRQVIAAAQSIEKLRGFRVFSTSNFPEAPQNYGDGHRVGIFGSPSAEFVAAMWGAWRGGGVAVPLAVTHPPAELLYVLQDSGVSTVAAHEEHRPLLEPLARECSASFVTLPPVHSAEVDGGASEEKSGLQDLMLHRQPLPGNDSAAMIIYTSGTTGRPKGAVHTHASLAAQAQMLAEAWEYSPSDTMLHCLPLHHVHGVVNGLIAPLSVGAAVDFMPKFSPQAVWARWRESYPDDGPPQEGAITMFTGVPTMYVRLLQAYEAMTPEEQQASAQAASKLRLMMCGSAALPDIVMEQWEAVTGHRLLERYGMTELGMALTNPLRGERRTGYVGAPFLEEQVKIVADDGEDPAPGESLVGELRVKSPAMFREYWRKPEATKKEFDDEGFFKTGDIVTVHNGYYKILGRASADIIKSGGYKLSALEIESELLEHPLIRECAVLGIADVDYGERIAAVVALKSTEGNLSVEDLKEWAKDKLAPYKVPTVLKLVESIPRNAMGKVNKKDLPQIMFG